MDIHQSSRILQKKVCILGPSGVGKTSLIKQYVEGIFSEKYHTSIGVKIDKKAVSLASDKNVELLIWDLEGIDKYCGFNPRYLRGASGIILVVDQSRVNSLAEAKEIYSMMELDADIPIFLAINKSDLPQAENWSANLSLLPDNYVTEVFNTSAKTGQSVDLLFIKMATHMVS